MVEQETENLCVAGSIPALGTTFSRFMAYSKEFYEATDVFSSCFVFASAGSGKTKILVDRFIKLMFFKVKPKDILCITFTNAAVFEMQERISEVLEKLVLDENEFTSKYLSETLLITPSESNILRAKELFFEFQDSLSNMNIVTVHSFCQKLLQKYPLESGILPKFRIVSRTDTEELLLKAKKSVLEDYINSGNYKDISILSGRISVYMLDEFLHDMISEASKFRLFFENNPDISEYRGFLEKTFKYENTKETSTFYSEKMRKILERNDVFDIFITKSGTLRKRIKIDGITQHEIELLSEEVFDKFTLEKKLKTIEKTCCFLEFAKKIYEKYEYLKKEQNLLDFSDIINKADFLLNESIAKEFIMSKVEHSIKHIMIDEAQDMSFSQWKIVESIFSEFFTDMNSENTIFVVGDIKQSIYGFQGASPTEFLKFYEKCSDLLSLTEKKFKTIHLNINYRTLNEILSFTDNVFNSEIGKLAFYYPNTSKEITKYKNHTPFRKEKNGICRMIECVDEKDVSDFICRLVSEEKIDESNIMVLTRSRNSLFNNIIQELSLRKINIHGFDKINFSESLVICDIMAVAKFIADNNDDYSVCCILKSPSIFDIPMSDFDILNLRQTYEKNVFESLKKYKPNYYEVLEKILTNTKNKDIFDIFYYISSFAIKNKDKRDECIIPRFLDSVLDYRESEKKQNIESFIEYFETSDREISVISKNVSSKEGVVFTTIHGAKGLESQTVVVLDFPLNTDKTKLKFIWKEIDEKLLFFIKPNKENSFTESDNIIEDIYEEENREILRLLYVALTRARDRLYLLGSFCKNGVFDKLKEITENVL